MKKTAAQIADDVLRKVALSETPYQGRRPIMLDSGAARQRAILRQKYLDAGHDAATADTYSQSAAQKLWRDNRESGGVPGYHKAVQAFQAPKPGSWVSPEETEKHMQNPALQSALLVAASKQQQGQ